MGGRYMHSGDVYVYLVSISHLVLLSSVAHGAHLCHGNRCVSIFRIVFAASGMPLVENYSGVTTMGYFVKRFCLRCNRETPHDITTGACRRYGYVKKSGV